MARVSKSTMIGELLQIDADDLVEEINTFLDSKA